MIVNALKALNKRTNLRDIPANSLKDSRRELGVSQTPGHAQTSPVSRWFAPLRALARFQKTAILAPMNTTISILSPTNDWIFKLLFGDERHKDNTIALLKSFLDLPEEEFDISFMDTALKPEFEEDKTGIVDLKIRTKSGHIIDVEIQVNPFPYLEKRISFYKSKLIVEQIGEGERYDVIRRVICVCILDYPFFRKESAYLNRFRYYNQENGLCFDGMPEEI